MSRSKIDPATETPAEAQAWADALVEDDELAAREAELVGKFARAHASSQLGFNQPRPRSAPSGSVERDTAFRNLECREFDILPDAIRNLAYEAVERGDKDMATHAAVASDPAYMTAFAKVLRDPINGTSEWNEAERAAYARVQAVQRSFTSGTNNSGQYMVPYPIDPQIIITGTGAINPIRQIANVVQLVQGNTWRGVSAGQLSASWYGENTAVADNTPTLAQPAIPVWKAMGYLPASFEAFEDISDLANQAVRLFADAKANLENTAFTTGTGSNQPKGVIYAVGSVTASRVSPTTAGTFGLPDIYAVQNALPARYSANAKWGASLTVINKMRRFGEGTTGSNSAFWSDLGGNTPPELLGRELYEFSGSSASLTTGQDILIYGDFERFNVVDRVGSTVEFVPNVMDTATGRPLGQRAWLFHWRTGSDLTDTADSFRVLRL